MAVALKRCVAKCLEGADCNVGCSVNECWASGALFHGSPNRHGPAIVECGRWCKRRVPREANEEVRIAIDSIDEARDRVTGWNSLFQAVHLDITIKRQREIRQLNPLK